ncbi:MAG: hypothetical protein XD63_0877, partial [Thermoanaerobacterales bacterium 50_218]
VCDKVIISLPILTFSQTDFTLTISQTDHKVKEQYLHKGVINVMILTINYYSQILHFEVSSVGVEQGGSLWWRY